jgi:hypothetical protein
LMGAVYRSLIAFGAGGFGRFLARHRGIGHWQGRIVVASISVAAGSSRCRNGKYTQP